MNCYEITFGDTLCRIEVATHRNTDADSAVYTAKPFSLDEDGALHWFADDKGQPMEVSSASEDGALMRVVKFLGSQLGRQSGHLAPTPEYDTAPRIEPPLPRRATES